MYGDDISKPKMRLDITKTELVNDVSLDDEVEVIVKGKVSRLDGISEYKGYEYKDGKDKEVNRKSPGCLEIAITSVKVVGKSEWDDE